ncbi:DNA-binding protein [Aeromonas jandaei]|uniref:DNA-binding protein n=1 Tax=Aeromonas TaxID=642 RepID=UPI001C248D3F|nr:DNA-binding protein [Aeromonas sp. FDAARGOS 1410]QXC39674.1 DNA-binding protein [Aeromonas sp. FDAARGOS 1410]
MSAHEIIRIANELAAKGITPTTAMIKARLSQPVAMAELLKVLSQWKQQPAGAPEASSQEQAAPAPVAEPTLLLLAEQLNRLERKVDRLTDLLIQQGKN